RTPARAADLVASLTAAQLQGDLDAAQVSLPAPDHDIYINTTPLGMKDGPDPAASPLDASVTSRLRRTAVVMDTVYRPSQTPLLRAAKEAGLRTVDGGPMSVRQAALQFSAWTGRAAPAGLFARIVREAEGAGP